MQTHPLGSSNTKVPYAIDDKIYLNSPKEIAELSSDFVASSLASEYNPATPFRRKKWHEQLHYFQRQ